VYTDNSKHRRAVNAGQVYRFVREMREGDYVLTYIKSSRELLIGRVTGGHAHKPDALDGTYDQIRPVAFGCEQPLIKAQVKHKQSTSGGPEMRSFIGTLRSEEKGIFVSTGGFTRDAKREAEHAHQTVTLFDRDEFIQLMLQHYEHLESEFKAQIPLQQVWVPAV